MFSKIFLPLLISGFLFAQTAGAEEVIVDNLPDQGIELPKTISVVSPVSPLFYAAEQGNPEGWIAAGPNDPYFYSQWGLYNEGQEFGGVLGISRGTAGADINVLPVWGKGFTGSGVKVAVVDTGANTTHKDLKDRFTEGSKNFVDNNTDVTDTNGHGTMVAGIVGATYNNGFGLSGVAPDISLVAYKSGPGPEISLDAVAAAFNTAGDNGVSVVNASIGGGYYKPVETAILENPNVLFIIASGNDGRNNDNTATYPCNLPAENIICVAATDANDQLAVFSNYGFKSVDIAAPGQDILSTYLGNSNAVFDGTSAAAPFVAGAAALLKDKYPDYTPLQIKQALLSTVTKKNSLKGIVASGGRLDIGAAIAAPKIVPPKIRVIPSVKAVGGTYRFGSTASFNLWTDKNANRFECRVDNQKSWIGCRKKLVIKAGSLSTGKHTLYVRSISATGTPSIPVSIAFTIDNTRPVVKILGARKSGNKIAVRFSAKGAVRIDCAVKGKGRLRFRRCAAPTWKFRSARKSNRVYIRATNKTGNTRTAAARLVVR